MVPTYTLYLLWMTFEDAASVLLLQKGRDHSPPKVRFEEPSFWLAHSAMGIHSAINIQITKQIGGGAQWVELSC